MRERERGTALEIQIQRCKTQSLPRWTQISAIHWSPFFARFDIKSLVKRCSEDLRNAPSKSRSPRCAPFNPASLFTRACVRASCNMIIECRASMCVYARASPLLIENKGRGKLRNCGGDTPHLRSRPSLARVRLIEYRDVVITVVGAACNLARRLRRGRARHICTLEIRASASAETPRGLSSRDPPVASSRFSSDGIPQSLRRDQR